MDRVQNFCFCTLAVGQRYRSHAMVLAQTIQEHAPGTALCILTDRPEQFLEFSHVLAFKHRLTSVKGYHDKRFVIGQALSQFETCLFLDADVQILGAMTEAIDWQEGITARTGCSLLKQLENRKNPQEAETVKAAAAALGTDLQQVQWFHEFMFGVRQDEATLNQFLNVWQTLSYFFELKGLYNSDGYAMGLAAAKVNMAVQFDRQDKFPFFKDNIEQVRIKTGQSTRQEKQIYFDRHRAIEFPDRPWLSKVQDKLFRQVAVLYRTYRMKVLARKDAELRKLFVA
jgi:hypothetical protein